MFYMANKYIYNSWNFMELLSVSLCYSIPSALTRLPNTNLRIHQFNFKSSHIIFCHILLFARIIRTQNYNRKFNDQMYSWLYILTNPISKLIFLLHQLLSQCQYIFWTDDRNAKMRNLFYCTFSQSHWNKILNSSQYILDTIYPVINIRCSP